MEATTDAARNPRRFQWVRAVNATCYCGHEGRLSYSNSPLAPPTLLFECRNRECKHHAVFLTVLEDTTVRVYCYYTYLHEQHQMGQSDERLRRYVNGQPLLFSTDPEWVVTRGRFVIAQCKTFEEAVHFAESF